MADSLAAEIAAHRECDCVLARIRSHCADCGHFAPCLVRRLTDREAALLLAGNAMADDLGHLLAGGIEMKPTAEGEMTFEGMLMLIQMLGVHRDAWRALAPADGEKSSHA